MLENKIAGKILVADDEQHIARLVTVTLERAGYKVEAVYNGRDAWERVQKNQYDLAVLDIMMPYMDGFELTKNIRASQEPRIRDLPIIMLTAKSQDADIFQGWQHGCDAYLTKPFNPQELITFMKRILAGQESEDKALQL